MNFENKFDNISWSNSGAEPSENLQSKGFEVGYKPSAGVFNWFWSKVMKAITEIQAKLTTSDDTANNHIENKTNPHGVTASQVGLGNVDNTADSEKNVAFASEAGVGRKVEYPLSVRFNGGGTESTDLWTYDGSTSKSINITPDKIGAAKNDLSNVDDEVFKEKVEANVTTGTPLVEATSTDGATYTATIEDITELYNGLEITIIPNMTSTKAAVQFNLNGLGAKNLRAKINGYNNGNSGTIAALDTWVGEGVPLTIRYIEKFNMWQTVDFSRPSVSGLYGTVKVEQGGTGATTAETARENLGVAPAIENTSYSGCYYRTVDGVTEWINPPMVADTEYRTTERFKGKPVFVKLLNVSNISKEATTTDFATGEILTGLTEVVDITGSYIQDGKKQSVGNGGLIAYINTTSALMLSFSEQSAYTDIYVTVKYVKE